MTRIFRSKECLLLLASNDRDKVFTHTRKYLLKLEDRYGDR